MSDPLEAVFELLLLCIIEIRDYRCGMYSLWPLFCIIAWSLTLCLASSPCKDACLLIISPIINVLLTLFGFIAVFTRWECMSQNYKYLAYIVYILVCLFFLCLHVALYIQYAKDKRKRDNDQSELTQRFLE
ncbi:unnamed protein product [Moneuplotes crassus]|uniref:Uncharacterized protein n=1 Tax=Euplotes crassus TaxID=5936 RepID=A0AAD1Y116_EUPCR|nr:unnamed protein product [Moneuplotes crassus]